MGDLDVHAFYLIGKLAVYPDLLDVCNVCVHACYMIGKLNAIYPDLLDVGDLGHAFYLIGKLLFILICRPEVILCSILSNQSATFYYKFNNTYAHAALTQGEELGV